MNASRRRTSGPVVPQRATVGQRWIARGIHALLTACTATLRFRVHDPGNALAITSREASVYAIWHNRLALSMAIHRRVILPAAPAGRRLAALVSASRDGALLAAILQAFGVEPVRGSSSRRGPQALLELKTWAARGLDLAITPDGPRGPCYEVQPGIVAAAAITGRAIIPVVANSRWKIPLGSWDRFQVPVPFGRWDIHLGTPLRMPEEADATALEAARVELQRRLMELTRD